MKTFLVYRKNRFNSEQRPLFFLETTQILRKYEFVCQQAKFSHFLENNWASLHNVWAKFMQISLYIWVKFLQNWTSLGKCFGKICTSPNWLGQFHAQPNLKNIGSEKSIVHQNRKLECYTCTGGSHKTCRG